MDTCFAPADILLPADDETARFWPVVACDQFTSQREYWQELEKLGGGQTFGAEYSFSRGIPG